VSQVQDPDQDRFERLRELGITEYGARTYLALLRLGVSEARAVSDVARVPQSKIYAVLDDLANDGLVHVHPDHPKKYSAADLAPFIEERRAEFADKAANLAAKKNELLALFKPEAMTAAILPGGAAQLRGRTQIARKVSELLDDTHDDWLVMGVPTTPALYEGLRPQLERAIERGTKLRFLLPVNETTAESARWMFPIAEVRARQADPALASRVTVVVSDARKAMLVHWASLSGEETAKDTALVTDDPAMANVILSMVDALWRSADAFETVAKKNSIRS